MEWRSTHCYQSDKTKGAAMDVNNTDRGKRKADFSYLVKTPQLTAYWIRLVTMESDLDHIIS